MTKDLNLYIGHDEMKFQFERDSKDWSTVRDEILFAMNHGKGTTTLPRSGAGRVVYIYSPALPVYWVEMND